MEKKYQIFISSTYSDLREERLAILHGILNMGHIPVGMELFNAADDTQWSVIKRLIDESDYYVLILSDRYGSIEDDGVGFTEKEYDYAISRNIPIIAFLRDQSSINTLPYEVRESDHKEKLIKFKEKIKKRLVKFWNHTNDLSLKLVISLSELIGSKPQLGWTKGLLPVNQSGFFYTLDDKPDANFPHLIKHAKKVYVLARTAVNLLGQYEKTIVELIQNNCDVRFLFIGPDSDAVKYIYGSSPEVYYDNVKKMNFHLENIKRKTNKTIETKTIKHAPTLSIIYIEKENGESFVIVQFYFLHALIGRDRPLFKLNKDDIWFAPFKQEFDELWKTGTSWEYSKQ